MIMVRKRAETSHSFRKLRSKVRLIFTIIYLNILIQGKTYRKISVLQCCLVEKKYKKVCHKKHTKNIQ